MEYKGYVARIEYDDGLKTFHGEVANLRDVVTFEADNARGLEKAFHESVDDYLEFCAERGEEPDRPYSGNFQVRISPDLHRAVAIAAKMAGKSLNAQVTDALANGVLESQLRRQRGSGYIIAESSVDTDTFTGMEYWYKMMFHALDKEGIKVPSTTQARLFDWIRLEFERQSDDAGPRREVPVKR